LGVFRSLRASPRLCTSDSVDFGPFFFFFLRVPSFLFSYQTCRIRPQSWRACSRFFPTTFRFPLPPVTGTWRTTSFSTPWRRARAAIFPEIIRCLRPAVGEVALLSCPGATLLHPGELQFVCLVAGPCPPHALLFMIPGAVLI